MFFLIFNTIAELVEEFERTFLTLQTNRYNCSII